MTKELNALKSLIESKNLKSIHFEKDNIPIRRIESYKKQLIELCNLYDEYYLPDLESYLKCYIFTYPNAKTFDIHIAILDQESENVLNSSYLVID